MTPILNLKPENPSEAPHGLDSITFDLTLNINSSVNEFNSSNDVSSDVGASGEGHASPSILQNFSLVITAGGSYLACNASIRWSSECSKMEEDDGEMCYENENIY